MAGWWRLSGPNCMLPTQRSNRSAVLAPGTELSGAETGPELASFALNARAETAVAKKICRHVFQIAELLRVPCVRVQLKSADGGVRSQIRTRLQRQFPASREINRVI
jgi:hypothetical protein